MHCVRAHVISQARAATAPIARGNYEIARRANIVTARVSKKRICISPIQIYSEDEIVGAHTEKEITCRGFILNFAPKRANTRSLCIFMVQHIPLII